MEPNDRQLVSLREEYKFLRSEIDWHLKLIAGFEVSLVVGLGFIFGSDKFDSVTIWGGPVLVVVAGVLAYGRFLRVIAIGRYIGKNLEPHLFPTGIGWERHLNPPTEGVKKVGIPAPDSRYFDWFKKSPLLYAYGINWVILFVAAVVGACVKG